MDKICAIINNFSKQNFIPRTEILYINKNKYWFCDQCKIILQNYSSSVWYLSTNTNYIKCDKCYKKLPTLLNFSEILPTDVFYKNRHNVVFLLRYLNEITIPDYTFSHISIDQVACAVELFYACFGENYEVKDYNECMFQFNDEITSKGELIKINNLILKLSSYNLVISQHESEWNNVNCVLKMDQLNKPYGSLNDNSNIHQHINIREWLPILWENEGCLLINVNKNSNYFSKIAITFTNEIYNQNASCNRIFLITEYNIENVMEIKNSNKWKYFLNYPNFLTKSNICDNTKFMYYLLTLFGINK